MRSVKSVMRKLGNTGGKKGFFFTITAIELLMEQETRCLNLSRDVYPEVAKRHQVNVSCVERDIRTMVEDCWLHGNRNLFHEIAGYELDHRPTVKEFLEMLHGYFLENE